MFRTIFIYIGTIVATIIVAPIVVVVALFSRTGNLAHRIARLWARSILWVSGIDVTVSGGSAIDRRLPYIFMANHQSNFDIPVLLAHLPVQFRWLAKAELFRIPVFGRAMRGCGYISIDRFNRDSAFQSLSQAAATIKNGTSVLIFPEGTRSPDATIRPFKKGPFVLAVDAGVPIVPVVICGTWSIMPKNRRIIKPCRVTLDILPPVATSGYGRNTKDELMENIRAVLSRHFARMKGDPACS
ncbi:MAG: lysophospholipid acyltransferase family protein [Desulfobacterales bacterium]